MVYFREKQLFDRWVYYLVGGSVTMAFLPLLLTPAEAQTASFVAMLLLAPLVAIFAACLLVLHTEVTDKEVHGALGVGRGLLHTRVPLADITNFEVVTYKAMDYGGYGFKGWAGKSTINARGDRGVLLHRTNGDQVIVGSQEPERLFRAIQEAKANAQ